jgi:hypothetical protein
MGKPWEIVNPFIFLPPNILSEVYRVFIVVN